MENNTNTFANGLFIKMPNERAPDFVLLDMSVKPQEFYTWCQQHVDEKGWVNLQIKRSKDGSKVYGQLNSWKPKTDTTATPAEPVSTIRHSSELEGNNKVNQEMAERMFTTGFTDEELAAMKDLPF